MVCITDSAMYNPSVEPSLVGRHVDPAGIENKISFIIDFSGRVYVTNKIRAYEVKRIAMKVLHFQY
jgi:hypothetical protein